MTQVTLREFLAHFFGQENVNRVWITNFPDSPHDVPPGAWTGRRLGETVALPPEDNQYFSIGLLEDDAPRGNAFVERHVMIAADDIGTKIDGAAADRLLDVFGKPTAEIETSPGNWTWLWKLALSVGRDETDRLKALTALRQWMKNNGLTDKACVDPARIMRLPWGRNTKLAYFGAGPTGFPEVYLDAWRPEQVVVLDDAMGLAFGEDWWDRLASGELEQGVSEALADMFRGGMGEFDADIDDPWVKMADVLGMNPRRVRRGRIECECPNVSEHSQRGDTGFAFLTSDGRCFCHHSHCIGQKSEFFMGMMRERYDAMGTLGLLPPGLPASAGEFLVQERTRALGGVSEDDPEFMRQVSALDRKMGPDSAQGRERLKRAAEKEKGSGSGGRARELDEDEARLFEDALVRFVHVAEADVWFDLVKRVKLSDSALDKHEDVVGFAPLGGKSANRGSVRLFNSGRCLRADSFGYRPRAGLFVDVKRDGATIRELNVWRDSMVDEKLGYDPLTGQVGVPRAWLELMGFLYRHTEALDFQLDLFALTLQGSARVPVFSVLQAGQGVGKDMAFSAFWRVLGSHNTSMVSDSMMESDYNDFLLYRAVYWPEARAGAKAYMRIKSYLTDNLEPVAINEKYGKRYRVEVCPMFFSTTNDMNAVAMDADDRRVFVYCSDAERELDPALVDRADVPGTPAWYARLYRELNDPLELARIKAWLLERDISQRDFRVVPDVNGSKKNVALASLNTVEAWIVDETADDGHFGGRQCLTQQELQELAATATNRIVRNTFNRNAAAEGLKHAGFVKGKQVYMNGRGSEQRVVWYRRELKPIVEAGTSLRQLYDTDRAAWEAKRQTMFAGLPGENVPADAPGTGESDPKTKMH